MPDVRALAYFVPSLALLACGPAPDAPPAPREGSASAGGGGESSSSSSSGQGGASTGASGGAVSHPAGAHLATNVRLASDAAPPKPSPQIAVGQTTAASLESLKYYVLSIQICEDVQTMGTATGQSTGCLEIFKGADPAAYAYDPADPNADFTSLADKARASDAGFIDLMDPASRAQLATDTPLGPMDARSYLWGLVYWALPVKVKASIPLSDGTTLYTHDGVTVRTPMGDGYVAYPTVSSTPLTTGPAEETVVLLTNGGTWIKFQNPLVVTQDDIQQGATLALDLALDPDGLIKGTSFGGPPPSLEDQGTPAYSVQVPFLDLTPVPHKQGDGVSIETYRATIAQGDDDFDLRLELYSIAGDPNRTIYGVDARTLANASTKTAFSDFIKVSFLGTGPGGGIDFQAWNKTPVISGFRRGAAPGDVATAVVKCGSAAHGLAEDDGVIFDGCDAGQITVTFTLESIRAL